MDFEPNFAWAPRFSTGTDLHSMVLHQKLPGPSTLVAGAYAFRFLQIIKWYASQKEIKLPRLVNFTADLYIFLRRV